MLGGFSFANLFINKQEIINRLLITFVIELVLHHAISFETIISLFIQLCLTVSLGIHKTACSINLFSGHSWYVETSHLISSAYWLNDFFAVGMSTDGAFRGNYTISFFVCLALNLLGLLRLLLIVFKYSVDLVFFRKCFSVLRIALFKWAGVWSMLDVVTSERCSLIFLNIPLFIRNSFVFKDAG